MSDVDPKDLNPFPPSEGVRPPVNEEEWHAWDMYAAAALTGSIWWNRHRPIGKPIEAVRYAVDDAAIIADELLELRRKRR